MTTPDEMRRFGTGRAYQPAVDAMRDYVRRHGNLARLGGVVMTPEPGWPAWADTPARRNVVIIDVLAAARRAAGRGRITAVITYRSPVECPACGHSFQGTWTSATDKQGQACPECGHAWPEAWAGWTLQPSVTVADTSP